MRLAQLTPHDRVISIEDTTELQCPVKNYLDLRAVGNVTMLDCLRACMRLKPTRIVVGEVRGAEAHTLLKAWNTGHPGGIATVHANDAMSGLIRLESLVAEATNAPQQMLIAEAVDLVIFVDEEPELAAGRKVREVLLVTGYRRRAVRGRARLAVMEFNSGGNEEDASCSYEIRRGSEHQARGINDPGAGVQHARCMLPRPATCPGSGRCRRSRRR